MVSDDHANVLLEMIDLEEDGKFDVFTEYGGVEERP